MNFKPLLATLLLLSGSAFGQGVQQGGTVTPGHAVQWTTNGTIQDAGTAASGTITSLGVTNNGGPGVCVNSAPITTDYNSICMAVNNTTGGQISVDNHGSATGGLSFVVNGTVVPIGGTSITVGGTAIVSGTSTYFLYNNAGLLGNLDLFGGANSWTGAQAFSGGATVPTLSSSDNSTHAASTAFVQAVAGGGGISSPANSMVGNWTNAIGSAASNVMPSCSDTGGNHLNYVAGSGVTCGSSINLPAFTGGDVTSSAGSIVLSIGPSRVTNGMILNGTINLTSKVTGTLPVANGGTAAATAAAALSNLGALPLTGGTMTGALILSSAIPGSALQAASKQYVDNLAAGLSVKQSVVAATTINGTLATAYENGDVIDDVTLATNDRILIKNQSAQLENGIYTVNASGAPTRATDLDVWSEAIGAFTFVTGGTVNITTGWVAQATAGGTINVTSLPFAQYSANSVYTNGAGLSLSGSTFSIGAGQVTNAMLGGSINAATKIDGSTIATVGTVTSGTWHSTAIGTQYGGTGQDFSGSTGFPIFTAGVAAVSSASATRTALGLGTAAVVNTGTSGATIPLLNGANTWGGAQAFSANVTATTVSINSAATTRPLLLSNTSTSGTLLDMQNLSAGGDVIQRMYNAGVTAGFSYGFNNTTSAFEIHNEIGALSGRPSILAVTGDSKVEINGPSTVYGSDPNFTFTANLPGAVGRMLLEATTPFLYLLDLTGQGGGDVTSHGSAILTEAYNSAGALRDALKINPGFSYSDAGHEQSDIDFVGYINGTGAQSLFLYQSGCVVSNVNCITPGPASLQPGSDATTDLGSFAARWQNAYVMSGVFTTSISVGSASPTTVPLSIHTGTDHNFAVTSALSSGAGIIVQSYNDAISLFEPLNFGGLSYRFYTGAVQIDSTLDVLSGYKSNGSVGISCPSGINAATFRSVNGIVTAC